jgi:hypothetical protein
LSDNPVVRRYGIHRELPGLYYGGDSKENKYNLYQIQIGRLIKSCELRALSFEQEEL